MYFQRPPTLWLRCTSSGVASVWSASRSLALVKTNSVLLSFLRVCTTRCFPPCLTHFASLPALEVIVHQILQLYLQAVRLALRWGLPAIRHSVKAPTACHKGHCGGASRLSALWDQKLLKWHRGPTGPAAATPSGRNQLGGRTSAILSHARCTIAPRHIQPPCRM